MSITDCLLLETIQRRAGAIIIRNKSNIKWNIRLNEIREKIKSVASALSVNLLRRSLNFPWQAPEVLTKDGAYTIQEERDVRNAMQLCSESFDL